jgi:hypothetical protein
MIKFGNFILHNLDYLLTIIFISMPFFAIFTSLYVGNNISARINENADGYLIINIGI